MARSGLSSAVVIVAAMEAACGGTFEPEPRDASGTYQGATASGDSVELILEQQDQALSGAGTVGGQQVVLSGPLTWSAVGTLTYANGSSALVRLTLSPDTRLLHMQGPGQEEVVLERGGTPVLLPDGPFSGTYQARDGGLVLAEATIIQRGTMVSGVGTILGQRAGVNGRTTDPDTLVGVVTNADESQVAFVAERSPDGSVLLRGFGSPIELQKE